MPRRPRRAKLPRAQANRLAAWFNQNWRAISRVAGLELRGSIDSVAAVQNINREIRNRFSDIAIRDKVSEIFGDVDARNAREVDRQLRTLFGRRRDVVPASTRQAVEARIEASAERLALNVANGRREIAQEIVSVLRARQPPGEAIKAVRARIDVARSRTRTASKDEVLSLNSELTEERNRANGVNQYRWLTARDERVRPFHRDHEGQIFSWDDPPVVNKAGDTGHPGDDYNCRCTALPVA